MHWLSMIIFINGVYDLVCAALILWGPATFAPHLHVFRQDPVPLLAQRLLAYWILTYGAIRVLGAPDSAVFVTYMAEAVCFLYEELVARDTKSWRVLWIGLVSAVLAVLVVLRAENTI